MESKYPYAIRSWEENQEELTVFFDFPVEIRKIIYTTNLIENLNGKSESTPKTNYHFNG
jgi:transposase-like protein